MQSLKTTMQIVHNIVDIGINKNSIVLIVLPHPDDETAYAAGLIQKIVRTTASCSLITFTKGESGRAVCEIDSPLATIRTHELTEACRIMGLRTIILKEFPDGNLEGKEREATTYVKEVIQTMRPNFVITLEPSGVYGHPDHIATSRIVTNVCKQQNTLQLIYITVDNRYKPSPNSLKMAKDPDAVKPLKPNVTVKLSPLETYKKIKA